MKKILVLGSMNMDFVTDLPHPLAVGETILAKNLRLVPGGKGANQAYAIGKLGGEVSMLGAVGADLHGERLCESLESVGVEISSIRKAGDSPTGMAVITVLPNGDNSILVLQGANAQVTPEYVRENHRLLEECDILVLQLEIPLETVVYAAKEAYSLGKQVILDPAPAVAGLPEELLHCLYLIKPNETELSILMGHSYCSESLRQDALCLQEKGVKNVLVTLGSAGSYLLLEDGSAHGGGSICAGGGYHSGRGRLCGCVGCSIGSGTGAGGSCPICHPGFQYCGDPSGSPDVHSFSRRSGTGFCPLISRESGKR